MDYSVDTVVLRNAATQVRTTATALRDGLAPAVEAAALSADTVPVLALRPRRWNATWMPWPAGWRVWPATTRIPRSATGRTSRPAAEATGTRTGKVLVMGQFAINTTEIFALAAATAALSAATAASGAAVVVGGVTTAVVLTNIRDWSSYDGARAGWAAARDQLESVAAELKDTAGAALTQWEGEAARIFGAYVENQLHPALDAMRQSAAAMIEACTSMSTAMQTSFYAVLGGTAVCTAACLAALAAAPETLGASLALQWGIVAGWVSFLTGVIAALVAVMTAAGSAVNGIGTGFSTLKAELDARGEVITGKATELLPQEVRVIADPRSWARIPEP